jgi:hypothetical protein
MAETARMRYRVDSITDAELHAAHLRRGGPSPDLEEHLKECTADPPCPYHPEVYLKVPPAVPGDTWRIHWGKPKGAKKRAPAPTAGYAICCPRCRQVHHWTTASNCPSRRQVSHTDPRDGTVYHMWTCDHEGTGSCWEWTGEAEKCTLTARGSLFANGPDHCGWHGYLTNGELKPA